MSYEIILERQNSLATIRLCRPERHNALDLADLAALEALLDEVAADAGLRVLVLTGMGDRTFCAGVNLGEVAGHDWRDNPLERVTDRLESVPVPTICVLNGGVYGGGTDLALACDFRIGVAGSRMFVPPAKLGLQYHAHGLRRAVSRLGLGPAKRLFLAAETFDDAEMLRVGFLDRLVPREELAAAVDALAANLAALSPLAVRGMKRTLNEIANGELDDAAARERAAASFRTEDFREGQRALAEKRPPVFGGR